MAVMGHMEKTYGSPPAVRLPPGDPVTPRGSGPVTGRSSLGRVVLPGHRVTGAHHGAQHALPDHDLDDARARLEWKHLKANETKPTHYISQTTPVPLQDLLQVKCRVPPDHSLGGLGWRSPRYPVGSSPGCCSPRPVGRTPTLPRGDGPTRKCRSGPCFGGSGPGVQPRPGGM